MPCTPDICNLFEQQLDRLATIGSTPVGLYGAGAFARELAPRARDHRGVVIGFVDDDERKQGRPWAGLPVMGIDDAIDSGMRSIVITAESAAQDRLWARRGALRRAGIQILCCPERFESRPWDNGLADFYDMMLARSRSISVPWVHAYPPENHHAPPEVVEFLSECLPGGGTVCEIGPGYGLITEHLIGASGAYHAVDYSERLLFEVLEHRFAEHLDRLHLHHDASAMLPAVPDASVDLLFSFDVFVHLPCDVTHQFLAAAARVLKPDGRVVLHFREWNRQSIVEWERHHRGHCVGQHSGMYFNDLNTLGASAEHLGFKVRRVPEIPRNWCGYLAEFTRA